MLEIRNLQTGYGKKQVIFDVSLSIKKGEIVALIGSNGSGKTTILKTLYGMLPIWNGKILFNGSSINNNLPKKNVSLGITLAPQGNRVFDELSVKENLEIGGFYLPKNQFSEQIEDVFKIFPILKNRLQQKANKLSSGERQMLAIGRALIIRPKLLLLDEPSLGLSPKLLKDVFRILIEINRKYGISMLVVEQKVMKVLLISHRVFAIKLGKVVFEGKSEELRNNREEIKRLFL